MKCPGCNNTLTTITVGTVDVDTCKDNCGGVWFDAGEFERYDEAREDAPQELLRAIGHANVAIDRSRIRACPRCESQSLKKLFFDSAKEIEVDQCPECAGVWLDPGELRTVREQNRGAVERKKVVDDFYAQAGAGALPSKQQRGLKAVLGLLFK